MAISKEEARARNRLYMQRYRSTERGRKACERTLLNSYARKLISCGYTVIPPRDAERDVQEVSM